MRTKTTRAWGYGILAGLVVAMAPGTRAQQPEEPAAAEEAPDAWISDNPGEAIDLTIALDTSGSMGGLIDSARLKLWEIVNDLTLFQPTPRLRVALISYGSRNNEDLKGWVRVETDLTDDLDLVSERLFSLQVGGGGEYVARVLQTAFEGLSWSESDDSLKLIFIAGNEPADQDPQVDLLDMSNEANLAGISIHAIYCGEPEHPHAVSWKEMAMRAKGQFSTINHTTGTVVVPTPFDRELADLSAAINETFLPVGDEGRERQRRLVEQDENAVGLSPSAAATRAQVKAGPLYSAGWDLVGALEAERLNLDSLPEEDLPKQLRPMSAEQRELHVEEMMRKRKELREQIGELSARRRQYVTEQTEAKGLDDSRAFDTALRKALREKLEENGFKAPGR